MSLLRPVELQTERLLLRAPIDADANDLLEMHASQEVMRFSNGLPWKSIDQAHSLIRSARSWLQSERHLCLCVVQKTSGRAIGTTTLYDFDAQNQRAEIGFLLSDLVWRHGYMSEALVVFLNHAFTNLNLNRVEADTDPRNRAAITLLESLGFVREGLFRQRWLVDGRRTDSAMYGLLRQDWAALTQQPVARGVA